MNPFFVLFCQHYRFEFVAWVSLVGGNKFRLILFTESEQKGAAM